MPTQAERRRVTRQRLLDAAAVVFARRGFAAASVDEIAKEAGYTTGAIYWHFQGKEDLFLAMAEEFAIDRVREIDDVLGDSAIDAAERARLVGDQWMARLAANPVRFRVAIEFRNYAQEHPEVREALAHRVGAVREAGARQIAREADAGDLALPLPPSELSAVVRALGLGLAIEWMTDPDAVRADLFGDFLYVLFRLLAGADPRAVRPPAR